MSRGTERGVDVRRAADRQVTRGPGTTSAHSFSFGAHYDPDNTGHGLLVAHSEHHLLAGAGFALHRHRDLEIVSWVLEGSLVHRDASGGAASVSPGVVQCLSAGSGVLHAETNDDWLTTGDPPHDRPVQLVQMWLVSDEGGAPPRYAQRDLADDLAGGDLVPMASGLARHPGALRLRSSTAALHVARLPPGGSVALPAAPYVHLFVARGDVLLEGSGRLDTGDAARLTAGGGERVTAREPAEVLVWEMHARAGE